MKKHLLTSTALAAAGALVLSAPALAQGKKPKLSISGWTEQIVGFADNDNTGAYSGGGDGIDQHTDSEIHFNGAVTLDNGINIRTRIELEGNTSGDQIDEHWMRISGSFGQVTLGAQDGAAQLMVTGYQGFWSTGVGQNLAFDTGDWIENPTGHEASSVQRVTTDTDAEKISYYTPRFAGFQVGASYVPNSNDEVNNTPGNRDTEDHEGYQIAANYVNKFGDVGIGVAVGYAQIQEADSVRDDLERWGMGVRLDFGGFRVGVGYVDTDEDARSASTGTTKSDEEAWDFGVRYSFGPNAVSLGYLTVDSDNNVAGAAEEETDIGMVSFRRTLGPGVTWTLNGFWAEYTGRTVGDSDDNEGYALTTSVKVRF